MIDNSPLTPALEEALIQCAEARVLAVRGPDGREWRYILNVHPRRDITETANQLIERGLAEIVAGVYAYVRATPAGEAYLPEHLRFFPAVPGRSAG
jgi:hypothetical protein